MRHTCSDEPTEHLLDLAMVPTAGAAQGVIWSWECSCGAYGADIELPAAVHAWLVHASFHRRLVRPERRRPDDHDADELVDDGGPVPPASDFDLAATDAAAAAGYPPLAVVRSTDA